MFSNYSEFTLHDNANDQEKKYSEFYSRIIEDYFDVKKIFTSKVEKGLESENVLPALEPASHQGYQQCAYILQFGVYDACLVVQKFYESSMACKKLIDMFITKPCINICCLGSPTISAVIGLCKVIEEAVKQFGFLDNVPTNIQLFIIDKNRKWKRLSEYIVAATNKEFAKVKLNLNFLAEELEANLSEKVKARIRKSHIITMVKYLSQFRSTKEFVKFTKNTLVNMKKNAVLFHLDEDFKDHQKLFKDVVKKNSHFSEIKSSHEPEKFTLNKETKLVHEQLYADMAPLNSVWSANIPPVMYSTWIKNPNIKLNSAVEVQPISDTNPHKRDYRARSSNTLRNSTEKFRLVGKFATMDMEKKNKDDSYRQQAKDAAVSRYANFDDCYTDY